MLSFPNAKINIGLYITQKREDGFHDLETVFYPVNITDALELVDDKPASAFLNTSGLPVEGSDQNNLVMRAYKLLQDEFPGQIPQLSLYLHKVIPMGAGLGGGSSDAAFLLKTMNQKFSLSLSEEQLKSYALQLGSDCPFFIHNKACFAKGRGELLQPIDLDLSEYAIVVVCPQLHVSTALAFSKIVPKKAGFDLSQLKSLELRKWKHHIANDFEPAVFAMHPQLAEIKEQLYRQGAIYASMSGSGSSVYGIFPKGAAVEVNTSLSCSIFTV